MENLGNSGSTPAPGGETPDLATPHQPKAQGRECWDKFEVGVHLGNISSAVESYGHRVGSEDPGYRRARAAIGRLRTINSGVVEAPGAAPGAGVTREDILGALKSAYVTGYCESYGSPASMDIGVMAIGEWEKSEKDYAILLKFPGPGAGTKEGGGHAHQ